MAFNKCCFTVNLRTGTFIIAYICLAFEAMSLILNSMMAWALSIQPSHFGYVYMQRFLLFLFMLLICFKLVLCAALLVGMFKRLPDHLEMWYKGYLLCVLVQSTVTICIAIKYDKANFWFWLILTERVIITLITIYFILVVRSYYFKMCKETNYYQNIVYTQHVNEQMNSEKPPKNHTYEEVKSNQPLGSKGVEKENSKYGFLKKGGGVVFSTPKSQPNAVIDMPMPTVFENDDKQLSMLYPSLA